MNIGSVNRLSQPGNSQAPAEPRPDTAAIAGSSDSGKSTAAAAHAPRPAAPPPSETRKIEQQAELSRQSVEKLVERIGKAIQIERRSLSFTVDTDLGKTILKVIDLETDEVIRQIPSEELLRIAEAIGNLNEQRAAGIETASGTGLLIQEKA